MTLQEALKTGKPYRRTGQFYFTKNLEGGSLVLRQEDILAEDWEVEAIPRYFDLNLQLQLIVEVTGPEAVPEFGSIRVQEVVR